MGILRTELGFGFVSTVGALGYVSSFSVSHLCNHPPTYRGRFPGVILIHPGKA